MANENETVEQITEEISNCCNCWAGHKRTDLAASVLRDWHKRILAAHKREIAAKDNERLTVAANYENVIAAKDREIAEKMKIIDGLVKEWSKRDALIKELADAVSENMTAQCEHCDLRQECQEGEDGIVVPCNQVIKLREALTKAREVCK